MVLKGVIHGGKLTAQVKEMAAVGRYATEQEAATTPIQTPGTLSRRQTSEQKH